MLKKYLLMVLCVSLVWFGNVFAQDNVTVPDLTGLSVPAAAALLNKNGLALGAETNQGWTADSGLEKNRIKAQSIAAGQTAAPGTAVDVTVLHAPNAILIYDDNDLSLVNNTGAEINLAGINFNALDGSPASLAGTRWSNGLRAGQCVQVWSVNRNGSKGLDECSAIQNWLATTNPSEHFWTGENGTTHFNIAQNGVQRADCPVANPGRCEFYLSGGADSDSTAYVYFAYTVDRLAVINQSTDQWMTLTGYNVYNNYAPTKGAPVPLGDPTLYNSVNPVAHVGQLAPGQCILFTNSDPNATQPPQPCDVIAQLNIGPSLIFWGAAFDVDSSDGQKRSCPVATAGRLTICVMPH
jgi:PASTA domain